MQLTDSFVLFTLAQGNMLIRLLLAHVLCEFIVFPQKELVAQNKIYLFLHAAIVYLCTALLTGWWLWSIGIALAHLIIEGIKIELEKQNRIGQFKLVIAEQIVHCIVLIILWSVNLGIGNQLLEAIRMPFTNYQFSLIFFGYLLVTVPVGYIIKLATKNMQKTNTPAPVPDLSVNRGKQIGILERMIILTFILLGQYAAIGFLITGKSIIRFANNDEHLRSEYMLIGTMMSYALCIGIGVSINWLLKI